jgi:hypothetical protein
LAGKHPFYLRIIAAEGEAELIDLDERGWATKYEALMRVPGIWTLNHKERGPEVMMLVFEGEQPYYTARHIGIVTGAGGEVVAYGIGKKRRDGHVDRLWVLPNGLVCGGDDVEELALAYLRGGVK